MPITEPPPFNLKRAFYFVVLAEELHFGRAAARLFIAQPGLSQQIKALESELGVTLVERGRRETRLTSAGELFRTEAARLLADTADLADRVRAHAGGYAPGLSIGSSRSAVFGETTQLVQDFRTLHPDIPVRTTAAWTTLNLEMLRTRQVDVVLVRAPVDDFETLTLLVEQHVVTLPSGHPLAKRPALTFADLADEDVVLWPRKNHPAHYDNLIKQIWGQQKPRVVLEVPDDEHIVEAVRDGVGLSVLETRRARHLQRDGVTIVGLVEPAPCELTLAWRRGDRSPDLAAFVNFCRERLPLPCAA